MRRVVSVWLPDWPITVWRRSRPPYASPDAAAQPEARPFALVDRTGRRVVLHAVDPVARHGFGLRPGQSHADARAIAPGLVSAPAEPEEEARALRALALWFERFSPVVATDGAMRGQEGLLLDMTGGAHLFGGDAALMADLRRRVTGAGFSARMLSSREMATVSWRALSTILARSPLISSAWCSASSARRVRWSSCSSHCR